MASTERTLKKKSEEKKLRCRIKTARRTISFYNLLKLILYEDRVSFGYRSTHDRTNMTSTSKSVPTASNSA